MAVKEQEPPTPEDELPTRRSCATSEVNERLIRTVDGYAEARSEIENRTYRVLSAGVALRTGCTQIPVVVHVVYRNAAENVSAAQIDSQIAVLNADFRAANADRSTTPSVFQPLIGDARVTFKLASTDPSGNPTDGITRTSTTTTPFNSDTDNVKSAATGGADPWPSDKYLNLWVCGNLRSGTGQALLGYAQFPGGPAATDGVVIVHTGFGTTGTAAAPFNLGRSATHEIGHWLNLRHIWGDDGNGCSGSDFVADTPNQAGPNFGAPTFPHPSCSNGPNGDLFMNYMDYVDDNTMYMFTRGQVDRMQAALDGPRSSIGVTGPCISKSDKELSKDFPKDHPKDLIKEDPKDLIKDSPKDFAKDRPKDLVKDNPKDFVKDRPKDIVKDRPKDGIKDRPKDLVKDRPKDLGKDFVDDIPKQLRDPVKQLGGEVGPIDPGPLTGPFTGPGGISDPGGVFGGGATPFVIGTGKDGAYAVEPDQGADGGALLGIAQQLGGLLADYANAAATGQLTGAEVARWQQLAGVYAQVIALLG